MVGRGIPASPILNGFCGDEDMGLQGLEPLLPGDRVRSP